MVSMKSLGENIKKYRKMRNLTQKELSEKSGIGLTTLQKYEYGKIDVQYSKILAIANVLETDINHLANDECFKHKDDIESDLKKECAC